MCYVRDELEKGVTWQETGRLPVLLSWWLLPFYPCQTEPSKGRLLLPLEDLCLALRSFCVQDRTGQRTNSASTQPAAETHTQEMPERSQELAYRMGQTYSQASARITACLTRLRGSWSGNPALSFFSAGLHSCTMLCCTQQNPVAQQVILCCLSFFSLEYYFSNGKLVSRLRIASAMRNLVTSLPILLKKHLPPHCSRNESICWT